MPCYVHVDLILDVEMFSLSVQYKIYVRLLIQFIFYWSLLQLNFIIDILLKLQQILICFCKF